MLIKYFPTHFDVEIEIAVDDALTANGDVWMVADVPKLLVLTLPRGLRLKLCIFDISAESLVCVEEEEFGSAEVNVILCSFNKNFLLALP